MPAGARQWLRRWQRRWFGWCWFRGDYATWAEAKAASGGYDDPAILARVVAATRVVRAGEAAWERDGTLFKEPAAHEPLLTILREIAVEQGGELEVVDFGGALGSTWWQHREWLRDLRRVSWRVVEQPGYVAAGRAEFSGEGLSFHTTLDEAGAAQVLLMSGVLQFLEEPYAMLDEVTRRGFRHLIIDRTPILPRGRERIVVQHTPPTLGGGSYPCRFFAQEFLFGNLSGEYELKATWPAGFDLLDGRTIFQGAHFKKRTAIH